MKAIGYYNKSLTNQVALISKNGRSFNIEFLGVEKDLPPVNKEILKVVGFDDNFFIRRLKLPLKKTQSLDKILPFQIENLTIK